MAAVFDALKKNTISRKFQLMRDAVDKELDVDIASHTEFNSSIKQSLTKKHLTRSFNIIKLALGSSL